MYERTSTTKRGAIKDSVSRQHMRLNPHRPGLARLKDFPGPGDLIRDVFGRGGHTDIHQVLKRSPNVNRIQQFTRRMEIEFEPVSELTSMSSAYCALFWEANSNWIVVAFKGTYFESDLAWLNDRLMRIQGLRPLSLMVRPRISTASFDLTKAQSGLPTSTLPAFLLVKTCRATETVSLTRVTLEPEPYRRIVHRGFKERIFPEKTTSSRSPYGGLSIARLFPEARLDYILIIETIVRGVDIVSKDLIKRLESKGENAEINVYFTGTSYTSLTYGPSDPCV